MGSNQKTWQKGKSGNPKGRPKKGRALTELLEKAGASKMEDGKTTKKQAVASIIWNALTTGRLMFGDKYSHTFVELDAGEYIGLAKMVYGQIDGPPKAEMDVTSGGEAVKNVMFVIREATAADVRHEDDEDDA